MKIASVFVNMTGQHLTLPAFGAYIPYPVGIGKMPALRKSLPLLLALALLGQAAGLRAEARPSGVGGRVVGDANPLSAAHIYAYQLSDLSLRKVLTDGQGSFLFQLSTDQASLETHAAAQHTYPNKDQ